MKVTKVVIASDELENKLKTKYKTRKNEKCRISVIL
jgi:hypothetical protein